MTYTIVYKPGGLWSIAETRTDGLIYRRHNATGLEDAMVQIATMTGRSVTVSVQLAE